MIQTLLSCGLAFFVTIAVIHLLHPLAIRLNLVDRPSERKRHLGAVPLIGGIAMFSGFALATLTLNISLYPFRSLIAASGILVFIGILDDFHELAPKTRFIAQIFSAFLITVWGNVNLIQLGDLFFLGPIHLTWFSVPFSIFAIIGVINAFNMLDGLDGLNGTLTLGYLSLWLFLSCRDPHIFHLISILLSVVFGFLLFNFPRHRFQQYHVFMGDAGSMFLGCVCAWFAIALTQSRALNYPPVLMIWILGLPLLDTLRVMFSRLWQRRSPFSPDRMHLHYWLIDRGFSNLQVVLMLLALSLGLGLLGLFLWYVGVSESVLCALWLFLFVLFFKLA